LTYDPQQLRDAHGMWSAQGAMENLHRQSLKRPLSDEEKQALQNYAEMGSDSINSMLRRNIPMHHSHVKDLDLAFAKASLVKSLDVYRVVEPDFAKFLAKQNEFKDNGFVSTSLLPNIANVLTDAYGNDDVYSFKKENTFKIKVPEKFPAIPMHEGLAESWPEKELLLHRGSRFIKTGPMEFRAAR
jgi:hypothetical protein